MTDPLDTLLRRTLTHRAESVQDGPGWDDDIVVAGGRRSWWPPLVAAAVVVLLIAAVTLLTRPAEKPTPPAGVRSLVDESWPAWEGGPREPWIVVSRRITPEIKELGFHHEDDAPSRPNCERCTAFPPSVQLRVYRPGGFDGAAHGGEAVTVGGRTAYYNAAAQTLALEFGDDTWAVAEDLMRTSARLRLADVLSRLRPDRHDPARWPLTLRALPADLPLVEISDSRNTVGGRLEFGTGAKTLEIFVDSRGTVDPYINPTAPWITVGGRDGRLDDSRRTAAVQIPPGEVVIFRAGPDLPLDVLRQALAGVQWADPLDDGAAWPAITSWTD